MAMIFGAIQFDPSAGMPSAGAPSAGSEVAMVARYVREDETHIARQREAIACLRIRGAATEDAERRLAAFESARRLHKAHLQRLVERSERERWGIGRRPG